MRRDAWPTPVPTVGRRRISSRPTAPASPPRRISRFARNDALLRYLGITAAPAHRPLHVDAEALERMGKALAPGPAPVAIHPGTSVGTEHKRYPAEGFAAVARSLVASEGVPVIVTAGPSEDDRAIARSVVEAAGSGVRLAPATPSLGDLAALFARSSLYVGADTGPMHVASLVGTPVVQLLGPTDPVENAPYPETPSRTVRVAVGCNPCRRGCAAATCMRVIEPPQVLAAARELLVGRRDEPAREGI